MTVVLVTGAGGPLGVNFCRSLRESSSEYRLIGTDANRYHLPLSLCDQTYRIPLAREGEPYFRAIAEIVERESVDVLVPTHPVEVRAIAELRDRGQFAAALALPATETLIVADDKAQTQARLKASGIPVPETLLLESAADVKAAFERYQRADEQRVWIRGSGAPGLGIGGAALPCTSIGVASAWIEHHNGYGKMAASPYLPGRNLTWMALYRHGELLASAARERLEYVLPHVSPSGITGAPAVSCTISDPVVEETGLKAVAALDSSAHGVYFVDLKGDDNEVPLVTEINAGRCGTTVHFYTRAGYNFPEALVRLALGRAQPHDTPRSCIAPGQYWVRTLDCGPALVSESDFDGYPTIEVD